MLKEATKGGKIGEFSVNTSSIIGTRVFIQSTISPSINKTTPSSSEGTFMLNEHIRISVKNSDGTCKYFTFGNLTTKKIIISPVVYLFYDCTFAP